MTDAKWLISRAKGSELKVNDVAELIRRGIERRKLYSAANDWVIMRDPGYSHGAWAWVAERTTRGKVELRGFDLLKYAQAWCETEGA